MIQGFIQARDEWPLLGWSVAHALEAHVDRVNVLLHASNDGSRAGLDRMAACWPGRLVVWEYPDGAYRQEASMNALLALAGPAPDDWVYVFDADEFMLGTPGAGLREAVASLPPQASVLRYTVQNWLAPYDLDDLEVADILRVCHRSVPSDFRLLPPDLAGDEVGAGYANFLDMPFADKVVFRWKDNVWVHAGAHAVSGAGEEVAVKPDSLRAAHLPFPGRRRLLLKAEQGRNLREGGFPPWHGWQSQLLALLEEDDDGGLDRFWATHSIGIEAAGLTPVVVKDDALSSALSSIPLTQRPMRRGDAFAAAPGPGATLPMRAVVSSLSRLMAARTRDAEIAAARTAEVQARLDDERRKAVALSETIVDLRAALEAQGVHGGADEQPVADPTG